MYLNLNIIMFSIILFLLLINWLEVKTEENFVSDILSENISDEDEDNTENISDDEKNTTIGP